MSDPFDLERFVSAQQSGYKQICAELRAGEKQGHWIWFIFPQVRGLGASSTSRHYAIGSLEEAAAYLAHPVLGPRLRECTKMVLDTQGASAEEIFGGLDSMKFRSSMTLFARASATAAGNDRDLFRKALDYFFGGKEDGRTLELLDLPPAR